MKTIDRHSWKRALTASAIPLACGIWLLISLASFENRRLSEQPAEAAISSPTNDPSQRFPQTMPTLPEGSFQSWQKEGRNASAKAEVVQEFESPVKRRKDKEPGAKADEVLVLSRETPGKSSKRKETLLAQVQNSPAKAVEPTYVVFQFQGPEGNVLINADFPRLVSEIKEEFGANPPGSARYVGFTPGLLLVQNLPAEELKAQVTQALDLAEQSGMPVLFHLDDMHFWYKRLELNRDPEAVEWSAFPKGGETYGPIVRRYWLSWGDWAVLPAPPPCFECPKFKADVADRLKTYVAKPIVARLEQWRTKGKDYLFAGIVVGNETQVPDHRMIASEGVDPQGVDITQPLGVRVRGNRNEMVRTGYASLYRRGYNAESLERLAKERKKTVDEVFTELLYDIAHDYSEFRAKTLNEAGIPRERLYTHFTSPFRPFMQQTKRTSSSAALGTAGSLALPPPVKTAVNPFSRPGFTVARDMVDLQDLTAQITQARSTDGGNGDLAWAVVESYPTTGQPGVSQTQGQYEAYLGGLFANGARVVNVFGWEIHPDLPPPHSTYAIKKAAGVIRAIKKWTSGAILPTTWVGLRTSQDQPTAMPVPPASLPPKLQKFQQMFERRRREGKDLTELQEIHREMESLAMQGKFTEVEALLDRALEVPDGNGK